MSQGSFSGQSVKSKNRNTLKTCAECGYASAQNWASHSTKHKHNNMWDGVSEIPSPWCENWKDVRQGKIQKRPVKPLNPQVAYRGGKERKNASVASSYISHNNLESLPYEENKMFSIDTTVGKRRPQQLCDELYHQTLQEELQQDHEAFQIPQIRQKTTTKMDNTGLYGGEQIKRLKVLSSQITASQDKHSFIISVLDASIYFQNKEVRDYLSLYPDEFDGIRGLLPLTVTRLSYFSASEIASFAYVCTVFGGAAWTTLPTLFKELKCDVASEAMNLFTSLLQNMFKPELALWIKTHWKFLEAQTLTLMQYVT